MTPKQCDYVADLCAMRAGVSIDKESPGLEHRLALVAGREGYSSVCGLVRALRERGEERLVWNVVEALSPAQADCFFRDPPVFEALARQLEASAARNSGLRVWSAACGAGQEIYSLAMLLEERGLDAVELFASDLSERRLQKAKSGLYSSFEVQQGLPARRLVRHFANRGDAFVLDPELRRRVLWRRMNLLDCVPQGAFDVVLCRYVVGAMLPRAKERALGALISALRPGGKLVLGVGEGLAAPSGLVPVPGLPGGFQIAEGIRAAA